MGELKPSAAGELVVTPLPNLLAYVLDHKLTGTLVVEDPGGGKSALGFRGGYPTKARTAESVILIGRLLSDRGLLQTMVADSLAQQATADGCLFGEYLVAKAIITRERVEEALREQCRRRIRWMFSLPIQSSYGFYPVDLLEGWGGVDDNPVAVLPLVWQGIRAHVSDERVCAVLARLGDAHLKLHIDARLDNFEFDRSEQALADVLRAKPQSVDGLVAAGLVAEDITRRMIYMLAITRYLDRGASGRPIGADEAPTQSGAGRSATRERVSLPSTQPRVSTRSSVPGRATGEWVVAEAAEMRRRVAQVLRQDDYQLLGVERNASPAVIQAAFVALARQWHPDRQVGQPDDVRELLARLFARLNEAHSTLIEPARRQAYDLTLERGGAATEQEKVARVLHAANAHQRAAILFKTNKLEAAEREARSAALDDPEQPEYLALWAWIQAHQPERVRAGRYDDLVELLNRAVMKDPENESARYWRGAVLKRAGHLEEAMRDFRWVSHANPRHTDAVREIRLYEMRTGAPPGVGAKASQSGHHPRAQSATPPSPSHQPGILRKLFKG